MVGSVSRVPWGRIWGSGLRISGLGHQAVRSLRSLRFLGVSVCGALVRFLVGVPGLVLLWSIVLSGASYGARSGLGGGGAAFR